jgi:F0F1-type ATP synthase assembly protein I
MLDCDLSPKSVIVEATIRTSAAAFLDIHAKAFGSGYKVASGELELVFGEATGYIPPMIPTITRWGLIIIVLLVLIGGALAIWRRRRRVAA